MSFIKLDEKHQVCADKTYFFEKQTISLINELEKVVGKNRWLSIGRTDIEKGFMALHKGITESSESESMEKATASKERVTHVLVVGNSPWDPR